MMKSAESLLKQHLLDTRRHVRRLLFRIWGGGFFFVVVGFAIAWFFIQPAPPKRIVIATGPTDGAYFEFAQMYSDYLAPQGIELELRETAGTIENYELLLNDKDVDLAIVQGGVASEEFVENNALETLGSLFFEPVWVFYRADKSIADLRDLDDLRIAIGVKNSGTAAISELLLAQNGLGEEDGVEFVYLGGHQAADELIAGSVDAAIFVLSPKSELVSELVPREDIKLLDFSRADAYVRRYPFFTSLILERGVLDMEGDYPREDLHLIAPAANMVATESLHEALVPMMLKAATESHRHVTHYFEPGRLPSTEFAEFPVNASAQRFFEEGPPFLQKYLPFWIASAIDRGKILLLPAITLLLPLFRIAPPLYRWRIRSRIYRWYEVLRGIEFALRAGIDDEQLQLHAKTLAEMEAELDKLQAVPLSYMDEFYNLRIHVEFVERRVLKVLEGKEDAFTPPTSDNLAEDEI